jgi:hypothetical protein
MKVEVIQVAVENKGKYNVANVTYKGPEGKVDGKKIMSFTFKDVYKVLSTAKQGDVFDVKSVKNEKGYWDWTEVSPAGKNIGGEVGEASAPRSEGFKAAVASGRNFETSEERAKRQVYIVRQSSLTAALTLAEVNKTKAPITEGDIIRSAKLFESFVFGIEPVHEVVETEVT